MTLFEWIESLAFLLRHYAITIQESRFRKKCMRDFCFILFYVQVNIKSRGKPRND